MANSIGWGKIYESTSWGVGVVNDIGWGIIYREYATFYLLGDDGYLLQQNGSKIII